MNHLAGKCIIWDGDSICSGSQARGSWASLIGPRNNMRWKNYAVGGGVITENAPVSKPGLTRHCVSENLALMYEEFPDADYIVLEGGTNDADLLGRILNGTGDTRFGAFSPYDFSGNYDRDTFCGALESVFYRATHYWMGKKIVFIIAQKMCEKRANLETFENRRRYFDAAAQICVKWGIPYLDLWHGCHLNPFLPWMFNGEKTTEENTLENTGYYVDGQHLSARGYDYTAEIIEHWLNTL